MKKIIEENMFMLMVIFMILKFLFGEIYVFSGTWNLNRTIGWGWEPYFYISECLFYSLPLFTIGYGALFFSRKRTNFWVSIIHLFLVLLMSFFIFEHTSFLIILLNLSWLVFFLNIYKSEKIEYQNI